MTVEQHNSTIRIAAVLSRDKQFPLRTPLNRRAHLQSRWPNNCGARLFSDPLEKLGCGLAKLWAVSHHHLQLLPVHSEPLLVLELQLALAVYIVPAALPGQTGAAVVQQEPAVERLN